MRTAPTSIIRHKYKTAYLLADLVSNIMGHSSRRTLSSCRTRCGQALLNKVKACSYLFIIMQTCSSCSALAGEFRIITFDYPPYTYGDGRDGLAIANIKQAFKQDLGYVNNINATHRFLVRRDFEGGIKNAKGLAVLRDDQNGINFAQKWHLEVYTVDNNEQSTEMLLAGRIDMISCIGTECGAIMDKSSGALHILDGSEEEFYVHIVFHRKTNSEIVTKFIDAMGWLKQQ